MLHQPTTLLHQELIIYVHLRVQPDAGALLQDWL
jgi:hypothetical protein